MDYFAKHPKYLVWDNIIHYSRRIMKNEKYHYFFPFRKPRQIMRFAFFVTDGFTTMTCDGAKAKVTIKSNKVTFSRCYGAKNPPQCASAKFW